MNTFKSVLMAGILLSAVGSEAMIAMEEITEVGKNVVLPQLFLISAARIISSTLHKNQVADAKTAAGFALIGGMGASIVAMAKSNVALDKGIYGAIGGLCFYIGTLHIFIPMTDEERDLAVEERDAIRKRKSDALKDEIAGHKELSSQNAKGRELLAMVQEQKIKLPEGFKFKTLSH